ncbi:Nop14-like protein [Mollisia scopiformis]|uniref:Nop14-like protein n=1 Tax=Mollisia scopiformis TaxID=149040 RepID=A0A194XRD1_MOLSC|nr:Nop14-like protein [Mollisia scopiformis]KUJ22845.1 Nop14-like protein [Mollisia scopiformis]
MPPSQLKRLKFSLREQGIIGPQQSKKQKKQNSQNGAKKEKKVHRNVALNGIREQFNPFDFQSLVKKPKFEVTTEHGIKGGVRRPGLAKSREEEARREAYIEEQQRRRKVGGILDKRFGENDPSLAPEDKMLERFTHEKQLRHKNSSAFDLEDDEEPGELTHMGKSLSLDDPALVDDFDEEDLELSDADDHPSDEEGARKRRRSDLEGSENDEEDEEDRPERKKSKQEVMKEVMAKSKLYKYERQAAKDEDEDQREELDKELSNIHDLLRGITRKPAPAPVVDLGGMNPERAALLTGLDKVKFDKEYDMRLKQLAQDQRAKPTEKSKPEEQVIEERARKLQELETKRLRRMQGEEEDSEEEDAKANKNAPKDDYEEEEEDFGFGAGIKTKSTMAELGVEDEDDFLIDDDLVASGSDLEEDDSDSVSDAEGEQELEDDEEDDFVKGILTEEEAKRPEFLTGANAPLPEVELPAENGVNGNLAYKFSCPQSHEELLEVTRGINILDFPTVIQRIRALYHPKLNAENKKKLENFSVALVDHISYLANQDQRPPFAVLETVIRHIHSLARTYPVGISNAFRRHLKDLDSSRAMSPTPGDLVILTAIGTVFPTSDHFHQVVTPAILSMGRFLGLKIPQNLSDLATGAYLCTICIQYQKLSKRYVPEVMNFIENSLCVLAPKKFAKLPGNFPYHEPKASLRIESAPDTSRRLQIYDCIAQDLSEEEQEVLKSALLDINLGLLDAAASTWTQKSAFTEVFGPALRIVQHLSGKNSRPKLSTDTQKSLTKLTQKLTLLLTQAHLSRRPLELHHHRPLAIKTFIPKFEESFNPERHYDPDKTRTETAKLKKEHKRERKGAIRELRKDANIMAIQSLKEKKERDAAYEKKYKRLVAEIQGEEGKEAKAYEREKEWRKKGRK